MELSRIEHGGQLRSASRRYGIALGEWLDLSTGINPHGWPVPAPCAEDWQRLPEADDGLEQAAAHYYGNASLLPMPGSQVAIQLLPRLRAPCRVGVLAPGYGEHAQAWRAAGHTVRPLHESQIAAALPELDVLILINPHNPTGVRFDAGTLLQWRRQLAGRGAWLVVDEAFMDVTPNESLVTHVGLPGLVVLRSLGKFFGLAGARVGFVFAEMELLQRLAQELGPWAISHPSRSVAAAALNDNAWQRRMRMDLPQASQRLAKLLRAAGLQPTAGSSLFQWVCSEAAERWEDELARQGVLVRRFERPASLRFGLPGEEHQWQRLEYALQELTVPDATLA